MQGEEQNWDKERRNTYIIVTKCIKKKTNYIIIFNGGRESRIEPWTSNTTKGVTITRLPLD